MDWIELFISEFSFWQVVLWGSIYFTMVYFLVSLITQWLARLYVVLNLARPIQEYKTSIKEYVFQVFYSLLTCFILGFMLYFFCLMIRSGNYSVSFSLQLGEILMDSFILLAMSALHFLIVHRTLHTPWLFKHVHITHHKVVIPTVWSIFTLHPVEAILLSSFYPLSLLFGEFNAMSFLIAPILNGFLTSYGHANVVWHRTFHIPRFFRFNINHYFHHNPAAKNAKTRSGKPNTSL